jgi:hypothetical protein
MWHQLADEMGLDVQTTFVIRDPRAVAESLHRRNGFTRNKSMMIWLNHTLMGEFHSRGVPRILVEYGTLLANVETFAPKLHGALQMSTPLDTFVSGAVSHVSGDMDHGGGFIDEDHDFAAARFAVEVFDALRSGADADQLDSMRRRFLEAAALYGPLLNDMRLANAQLVERF